MIRDKRVLGKSNLVDKNYMIDKTILGMAKKRKQIIYGARSIQAQNPLFARDTKDYDIFDKNPKKIAKIVEHLLDKEMGFDYYYTKEAEHKGTFKIKGKGYDFKKNTEDDESIADYTDMPKRVPFVVINGIRYRKLKNELERKRATVQDPEFKFRHEKDRDDIRRIKGYLKVKKIIGGLGV